MTPTHICSVLIFFLLHFHSALVSPLVGTPTSVSTLLKWLTPLNYGKLVTLLLIPLQAVLSIQRRAQFERICGAYSREATTFRSSQWKRQISCLCSYGPYLSISLYLTILCYLDY